MATIVLWNSVAKRRRSISDTFYDNGLATLKGYLEQKGHQVEVIDWANDDFYAQLSEGWISRFLRRLYGKLFLMKKRGLIRKLFGLVSIQAQEALSSIQELRIKQRMRAFAKEVKKNRVRILGIKVWYGEAFRNAQYLVRMVKKYAPEVITVAGGYHATLYEEHLLTESDFDLGVVCEGEEVLEKILALLDSRVDALKAAILEEVAALAEGGSLLNLIYRKGDAILRTKRKYLTVHSSKSIPRYTMRENKVRIHVMVESLGCDWGKCNFCVHPYFYPHYSLRDPDEIVSEIAAMRKLGIGVFRFAGSDTPPHFGAKIGAKILEKKLSVVFGMGSRAIRNAKQHYEQLVASYAVLIQAGLRAVFMGGETGNDLINQEVMNKGVYFEDIVYTIAALREAQKRAHEQVFISLAFIYPTPLLGKVTLEEVKRDNIRLLRETLPDSCMITPPGPFLHTRWYNEKEEFGFGVEDSIIPSAMRYEYVLYKPPSLWPQLEISLEGKPFKRLLEECNEFRNQVEGELAIPTDISDEHFLMFYCAGLRKKEEILKIKNDTMLDVVSCDYSVTRVLSAKVNAFSEMLAKKESV